MTQRQHVRVLWTLVAALVAAVFVAALWPTLASTTAAVFTDTSPARASSVDHHVEVARALASADRGYHHLVKGTVPAITVKWQRSAQHARWIQALALVALAGYLHLLVRGHPRAPVPVRAPRSRATVPDGGRGPPHHPSSSALRRPAQRNVAVPRDHRSEVLAHVRTHLGSGRTRPTRAPLGPRARHRPTALA